MIYFVRIDLCEDSVESPIVRVRTSMEQGDGGSIFSRAPVSPQMWDDLVREPPLSHTSGRKRHSLRGLPGHRSFKFGPDESVPDRPGTVSLERTVDEMSTPLRFFRPVPLCFPADV